MESHQNRTVEFRGMSNTRSFVRFGALWCAALVCLFSAGQAGAQQGTGRGHRRGGRAEMARTLAGGWQLVSRAVTSENGAPVVDRSLGATPTGYLTYDPGGRMAVQIMRNDRSAAIDCGVSDSTVVANNTQSISGYDAYFGTYTVDESKRTVTHHAEGASRGIRCWQESRPHIRVIRR